MAKLLVRKVESYAGIDIEEAVAEAIELATRQDNGVELIFRDKIIHIYPNSSMQEVVVAYYEACRTGSKLVTTQK